MWVRLTWNLFAALAGLAILFHVWQSVSASDFVWLERLGGFVALCSAALAIVYLRSDRQDEKIEADFRTAVEGFRDVTNDAPFSPDELARILGKLRRAHVDRAYRLILIGALGAALQAYAEFALAGLEVVVAALDCALWSLLWPDMLRS